LIEFLHKLLAMLRFFQKFYVLRENVHEELKVLGTLLLAVQILLLINPSLLHQFDRHKVTNLI